MLIWPPYADSLAVETLKSFRENGGTKIIYVGEESGGCTADSDFFDELSKNWIQVQKIQICQWDGINDDCGFFQLNN